MMRCDIYIYIYIYTGGCWVVSVEWVTHSLKQRTLLPEAEYEVQRNAKATVDFAPRRAREFRLMSAPGGREGEGEGEGERYFSPLANPCKNSASSSSASASASPGAKQHLFSGCISMLYGQFPTPGPPRSDLEYLLRRGAGRVCPSLLDFLSTVAASQHGRSLPVAETAVNLTGTSSSFRNCKITDVATANVICKPWAVR
jgi:hypothetical protein